MIRLCGIMLMILASTLVACRTTSPHSSDIETDETQKDLRKLCGTFLPHGEIADLGGKLCACISGRRTSAIEDEVCTQAGWKKFTDRVRRLVIAEGEEAFQSTQGGPLSSLDEACLASMTEFYLELRLESIANDCADPKVSDAEFRSLMTLPETASPGGCWVFSQMTDEACIKARPCRNSGGASPFHLPISENAVQELRSRGVELIKESESVELCNDRIQEIHNLKDPKKANISFNLAFANLLGFGRVNNKVSYAPANCHGTAAAVAGQLLDEFEVKSLTYHSQEVERRCGAVAKMRFDTAAAEGPVKAKDLPVKRGGYLVNMNHSAGCAPTECGDVSFSISNCDGEDLEASIFFEGMCVACWEKTLESRGLKRLPVDSSWKDLTAGCVLTTSDHSVAYLHEGNGMCYFYESTTPFGPPQLHVELCNVLYRRFEKRWCPEKPFSFDIRF